MGGGQQQESELYGVAAEPTVCHPWSPLSEMALAGVSLFRFTHEENEAPAGSDLLRSHSAAEKRRQV